MTTIPALAKENGEERTPRRQTRLKPPPMSTGRNFGTPLSNCSSVPSRSVTTSKKVQLRQQQQSSSSSANSAKKIVRARKLVQQHRTPASTSFSSGFSSPSAPTPTPPVDNTTTSGTYQYVVTFLPGPMGFQPEPTQENNNCGCRVKSFVDDAPENPGQARRSNQVQEGDIIVEIDDENVSEWGHNAIVDRLKDTAHMPRKVLFRRPSSQQLLLAPPPTAPRTFHLNSQGAFTPVLSPPAEETIMSSEKKSVSSVLFMDPSQTPTTATPNVSDRPGSATSPPSPLSSAYNLLALGQTNVVLDVNDDDARSQSIDTTSTISPSKVKNLSQEDLELGLGLTFGVGSNKPNGSMAMVLRNVYNSVVGKKAVLSKLGGNQDGLPSTEKENKVSSEKDIAIENDDTSSEEKKDIDSPVVPQQDFQATRDHLHEAQDKETNRFEWLELQLTEANGRAETLKRSLDSKQAEMDRRLQEAQDEANARVHQISQVQLTTQTDLEQKFLDLKRELEEANTKASNLSKEKDESQAALEAIMQQLKEVETRTESQKSTQLEAQLQVAKLQTELRDEKKEIERLKSDFAACKENQHDAETLLQAAEVKLSEKQEELEGTKCMMETYEEKFMERETDLDVLTEEKDFASREIQFARSENQRLLSALQQRESELAATNTEMSQTVQELQASLQQRQSELDELTADAENETRRFQECINMASKELADTKQQGYDRERELQTQLTQRDIELQETQSELMQMKASATDAVERERALTDALEKRDADLDALNCEIDSKIAALNDELRQKEESLEETARSLESAKAKNESLVQENQNQAKDLNFVLSELQASLTKRDEELAAKSDELVATKEAATATQQAKDILEKEAKELKEAANSIYGEKMRVTKELQTAKFELSDMRLKATKTQDALLQRAKQMDGKAKDAQAQLKKKENEELALLQQKERAQQKIEALSVENEQLLSVVETMTSDIKSLEEQRGNLSRREIQLQAVLEEKEREKQALMLSTRDMKSTLFEASSRISFLERTLKESEALQTIFEQEANGRKEEIDALNSRVESQRESLDNKSWELSRQSTEVMNLKNTLETVREELQQKTFEVDSANASLTSAQAQYTQLNECFVAAAEESSSKIQGLTADLIMAQDEVADNLKTRSKLERHIVTMKQQIQDGEDQLSETRAQLVAETEKSTELANSIEAQGRAWETKKAELQEEMDRNCALTKKLEEECQARSQENANLVVDIASLEQKLSNARALFGSEQAKHKKDRAELEETISSHKKDVADLSERLSETTSDLEGVRKQLKDTEIRYEDQLVIMRNSTASKESKLSQLLMEREEGNKALSNMQEELSLSKLEIQRLDESRKRSRDEVASLTAMMDSLQADHTKQQDALVEKHRESSLKLLKDKEQVESSIRKLQEVKLSMQKRIQELEARVEEEHDRNECHTLEQDALTTSLHRAEDMVADLTCQLNILNEQANESIDSLDSATLVLTKSELRMKCKYLAEEVQEVEMRAASGTQSISQKQNHIRRLEEDVSEMSAELGRMIESSEQLEAALLKARMDKATSDSDAEALRASIGVHQAKTAALKEELDHQYDENSQLLDQLRDFQTQLKESEEREDSIGSDLAESRQALQLLSDENAEEKLEVARISQELAAVNEKRESALTRVSVLESEISKLEDRLMASEEEKEFLQTESQGDRERFEAQLRETRNETASLRSTIAEFEAEIEGQQQSIRALEEKQILGQENLDKARKFGLKMETLREEAVTKLTEASRVLAAQKGIISVQEARAAEAEAKALQLSDEVSALKESIQKLESTTEENGMFRSSQLEELERRRAQLEKARVTAKAEAETLRDELRSTQRKASELGRINKAQEARINELKSTAEATKAQLREARGAWADSEQNSRTLENAIQQSRADTDSMRAKLTLSGATIARLKSDRALLQEAALQANSRSIINGDSNAVAQELSQLQAALHTKASQLSTASTNLRNYKKMVADMKTTEVSLVSFIEEIIVQAKTTFEELSRLSSALKELSPTKCSSPTAESASPTTPEKVFDDAKCCLGTVVALIKEASVSLEGKRRKLNTWKAQSNLHASTPNGKAMAPAALLTPNESSALRSFRRMKEVVESHVSTSTNGDSKQQVEAVIVSLEGQIDALCSELKAANVALQAKDKVFSDQQAKIYALEHKATSMKDSGKLSAIQEANEYDKEKVKMAAGRMIAKVLENKARAEVSTGLRQWSTAAAGMHAADQQRHAAETLSKTLETTREKLVLLKMQHKRSKAGSNY